MEGDAGAMGGTAIGVEGDACNRRTDAGTET